MNKTMTLRVDQETINILEQIKKEYKISKSDAIRMAIQHYKNYMDKVSK